MTTPRHHPHSDTFMSILLNFIGCIAVIATGWTILWCMR